MDRWSSFGSFSRSSRWCPGLENFLGLGSPNEDYCDQDQVIVVDQQASSPLSCFDTRASHHRSSYNPSYLPFSSPLIFISQSINLSVPGSQIRRCKFIFSRPRSPSLLPSPWFLHLDELNQRRSISYCDVYNFNPGLSAFFFSFSLSFHD